MGTQRRHLERNTPIANIAALDEPNSIQSRISAFGTIVTHKGHPIADSPICDLILYPTKRGDSSGKEILVYTGVGNQEMVCERICLPFSRLLAKINPFLNLS